MSAATVAKPWGAPSASMVAIAASMEAWEAMAVRLEPEEARRKVVNIWPLRFGLTNKHNPQSRCNKKVAGSTFSLPQKVSNPYDARPRALLGIRIPRPHRHPCLRGSPGKRG